MLNSKHILVVNRSVNLLFSNLVIVSFIAKINYFVLNALQKSIQFMLHYRNPKLRFSPKLAVPVTLRRMIMTLTHI